MKITDKKYFSLYSKEIGNQIDTLISKFVFAETDTDFSYLTKSSAVYSSNIEGNSIDLNSFMNYELSKEKFKVGKEIEEIQNLIAAYSFAQKNKLTEENMLFCHKKSTKTLLIKSKRGRYRVERVGVFGKLGLAYLAVEPEFVAENMKELFEEIALLLATELTNEEVFYHASLLHLKFVHIHPFRDGNGRIARLVEKWFLAEKLGLNFWGVSSEEFYKKNQQKYYDSINIGVNFYELNYDKSLAFLKLLPNSLKL